MSLCGLARDEFELLNDLHDGHLEFQQSQTHAEAVPRSDSERHVNGRVAIGFVFSAESTAVNRRTTLTEHPQVHVHIC